MKREAKETEQESQISNDSNDDFLGTALQSMDESRDDLMDNLRGLSRCVSQQVNALFDSLNCQSQQVALKIESSLNNLNQKHKPDARPCYIWNEPVPLPNSPRFACVGRVITETPEGCTVQKGDRVASMISKGEDFECYAKVPLSDVIKVPDDIDACVALVLMITYMTAYQSLSVGQTTLAGEKVMIVGGIGPVCQACIELALLSGARVYVPALREYHAYLSTLGAKPIDCHPQDWTIKDGSMNLIIDAICSDELKTPQMKLAPSGKLVSIGSSAMDVYSADDDFLSKLEKFWFQNTASFTTRATFFGLMRSWENDRATYERDLNHLFYLFAKKKICPKISAYASLAEYPKLRSGIKGTVVCVPCQE